MTALTGKLNQRSHGVKKMKIAGKRPNLYKTYTLDVQDDVGEIFTFVLTPPPIDFFQKVEKIIPTPTPPKTFARDSRGKLEKDENGRAIVIRDEDDAKYKERVRDAQQLQSTALVHESLRNDKNIEFDTKLPEEPDEQFYKAIRKEILELIPMPVFLKLVEKASSLLSISEEVIEEAKESFRTR